MNLILFPSTDGSVTISAVHVYMLNVSIWAPKSHFLCLPTCRAVSLHIDFSLYIWSEQFYIKWKRHLYFTAYSRNCYNLVTRQPRTAFNLQLNNLCPMKIYIYISCIHTCKFSCITVTLKTLLLFISVLCWGIKTLHIYWFWFPLLFTLL